jgi:GntR family transcriptional regulator, transcriptional repressor for pyruvate dehydrogenase complex
MTTIPLTVSRLPAATNRSEQVAEALGTRIRAGALAAGFQLPSENALAQQFGVSRTVVREAIARLKSEGLLETRQGAGAFVADPRTRAASLRLDPALAQSIVSVLQIVELRKGLEAEAAALAAARRDAAELAAIHAALDAIAADVHAGGDGVQADVAFHRAIAAATHNPYFTATLDYLQHFLHGAVSITRANEARRADLMREVEGEHQAIVDAILRQDSGGAREAVLAHVQNAARRIEQADS